jgi:hypothetical protein
MPNRGVHHAAHHGAHRAAHNGAHRGVRTIALPWRKAYVALPAIGLIAVGTALVAPADAVKGVTVSKDPTAVVVPGAALTLAHIQPDQFAAGTQAAPDRESSKTDSAYQATKTAKEANHHPAPRPTSPNGQEPRATSGPPATTAPSSPGPSLALPLPTLPLPVLTANILSSARANFAGSGGGQALSGPGATNV